MAAAPGFGFDDENFSDRILRIEILPDFLELEPDSDESVGDWPRIRKRRRRDDPLSNANRDEIVRDNDPSSSMEYSGVQVRNVHINSLLLAWRSPFFFKLFSNGMKESKQKHATLQIQASEEDAVLDLLKYMYSNTLPRTTPTALLDVLLVADKFEVASCMRDCCQLLHSSPMSCESAMLYLNFPSIVSMPDTVQQLIDAAKEFIADRFNNLSKYQEEVLKLPLAGIEAVLSSDDLEVASEDVIFDFLLKWARSHYPNMEERRNIMSKHLLRLIRFPFMPCNKLKQALTCNDIDPDVASKLVIDALFFKIATLHQLQQNSIQLAEYANASNHQYVERSYRSRTLKAVEFASSLQQCVAFWDLKRDECEQLVSKGVTYSWQFHLGRGLFFTGEFAYANHPTSYICFRLLYERAEERPTAFKVDCEFAVRMHPSKEFVKKCKWKEVVFGEVGSGFVSSHIIFYRPWSAFMADDSSYFINGVVHLRLVLTLKD